MSEEDFELVRGSGNVFRDFGDPNADLEQAGLSSRPRSFVCWMTGSWVRARPRV